MQIEIKYGPSYALCVCQLAAGETVVAEPGAMVSMSSNIEIETTKPAGGGGLLGGLKRLAGGESFFQNKFTAQGGPGLVDLAPSQVGDVKVLELSGQTLYIQGSAWLASGPDVVLDTKFKGAKKLFTGGSMFMLAASGTGPVAFNAFGALKEIDIDGSFTIDTGHIVAYEEGLSVSKRKFGGWKTFLLSGEGFVSHVTGKGKLYLQTRNPSAFGQAVGAMLPPRKR